MREYPETILQFGTGKFLRAFADLFVHELNERGAAAGRIVAVQTTGVERARALRARQCRYSVGIRGLEDGRSVDRTVEVRSIGRALTTETDWPEVLEAARGPSLRAILSNTTEAGYALDPADSSRAHPPRSFPAKLLAVLAARFEAGGEGVTVLPCELVERNGRRLLDLVLEQAGRWGSPDALIDWLQSDCRWRNTLVDRIVAAPSPGDPLRKSDPLAAVAEPFALWLIEGPAPSPRIAGHPAIRHVEQLEPYYLRKVRILNGAHTALVAKALPRGCATVREAVLDPELGPWLRRLLFEEIVPALEGRTEEPQRFAEQVLERFANPFLEHRLADIALHHDVKLQTRLVPTHDEYCRHFGRAPPLLDELIRRPREA